IYNNKFMKGVDPKFISNRFDIEALVTDEKNSGASASKKVFKIVGSTIPQTNVELMMKSNITPLGIKIYSQEFQLAQNISTPSSREDVRNLLVKKYGAQSSSDVDAAISDVFHDEIAYQNALSAFFGVFKTALGYCNPWKKSADFENIMKDCASLKESMNLESKDLGEIVSAEAEIVQDLSESVYVDALTEEQYIKTFEPSYEIIVAEDASPIHSDLVW
ncbi:MAG: hypothetical protein SFT91_03575, partial [Rickettsiaceae bacterium]|nr:hypothetical protein [Rickettsiaceae bacterium]